MDSNNVHLSRDYLNCYKINQFNNDSIHESKFFSSFSDSKISSINFNNKDENNSLINENLSKDYSYFYKNIQFNSNSLNGSSFGSPISSTQKAVYNFKNNEENNLFLNEPINLDKFIEQNNLSKYKSEKTYVNDIIIGNNNENLDIKTLKLPNCFSEVKKNNKYCLKELSNNENSYFEKEKPIYNSENKKLCHEIDLFNNYRPNKISGF